MTLQRHQWMLNRRPKLPTFSPEFYQNWNSRKSELPKLGENVEAILEVRKAKKDDVVRYGGRICKITYVHPDKTVNLSAFKGAPFNSQHTPIADLEFANEDGSFAVMEVEPEITLIVPPPQAPPARKLLVRPDETVIVFDYAGLTVEARIVVQQKTSEIRERVESMKRSASEIGQRLIDVKAQLNHGEFGAWLRTEFNWSQDTAERMMAVTRMTAQNPQIAEYEDRFQKMALVALSAPTTPPAAIQAAVERVQELPPETQLTHAETKQIIAEAKAAEPELIVTPTGALVDDNGEIHNREIPAPTAAAKPAKAPRKPTTEDVVDLLTKCSDNALEALLEVVQCASESRLNLSELSALIRETVYERGAQER